jgi:hypothetical protein
LVGSGLPIIALSQKYLERLRQRFSQGPSTGKASKTVTPEQMALLDAAIKQQRTKCQQEGWRASAKWLEQNCEEYRQPRNGEVSNATNGTRSSINCLNSEPANEMPTVEPIVGAPELPQSAREALPAPSPIPLASAFWQSLLFGNPDSLVSSFDATRALQLVSDKLGVPIADGETISTMRAGQLRKLLRDRFGPADAEQTTAALWRAASASPGASTPNEDQSQVSPGIKDCPRDMPAWRREFHQEINNGQRLLESMGGWCG